jgi:muramidase (phage lysozyme)
VFESRVLRRIFGPNRDQVTGWRKLHNEQLHNLYSSPSIIKSDQVKKEEMCGACSTKGGRGMLIGYWWESQKERDHLEDQDVGGWTG